MAATFVVACYHPAGLELLGTRKPRGKRWIVVVVVGGAIGAITTFAMLAARTEGHPLMRQLSLPEVILTIWLLSSVSEEFYCRGLIQPWTDDGNDRCWSHPATFASALIFGAMHLSLLFDGAAPTTVGIIILATTFLGFLCAAMRRASCSVWPAIATHVAFNIGGVAGAIIAVLILGSEILPTQSKSKHLPLPTPSEVRISEARNDQQRACPGKPFEGTVCLSLAQVESVMCS